MTSKHEKNLSIPIIDAHQHFWDLSMLKHPWLCEKPLIKFRYGDYLKFAKIFYHLII